MRGITKAAVKPRSEKLIHAENANGLPLRCAAQSRENRTQHHLSDNREIDGAAPST